MRVAKPAAAGNFLQLGEHLGEIIVAIGPIKDTVDTQNGEADVARCTRVVVLDTKGTETFDDIDVLVFGKAFAPALWRANPDQYPDMAVVGLIAQGEPGKGGKNAAWLCAAVEEGTDAFATATAWIAGEEDRRAVEKEPAKAAKAVTRLG